MDGELNFMLGKIIARLEENDKCHSRIEECLSDIQEIQAKCTVAVATLKEKARMWGAIAGLISSGLILIISHYILKWL